MDDPQDANSSALADPVARGEQLFVSETFEGNGRTCATCHVLENFGTLSPEWVQARWDADPADPLFRALDSDDGLGGGYERIRRDATVRVPIPLPVHPEIGVAVRRCDAPADTVVWLNRGNPSVFNIAVVRDLMVDGRDGDDLAVQARNAVNTHAEPGREPTPEELADIAEFQETLFSHEAVRRFLHESAELGLPEGRTPSEIRGRAFFDEDRQCGVCHTGPLLNETSAGHPDGPGLLFETAQVGQNPDNPNPKFDWCWVDPATHEIVVGPNESTVASVAPTSDPGRALLPGTFRFPGQNGEPDEDVPNAILLSELGSWFRIPTLWGSPDTAPYFHDNSALDLMAVLDHYNILFSNLEDGLFDIPCTFGDPECLSPQDKDDIIAFMQLLSFENRPGAGR